MELELFEAIAGRIDRAWEAHGYADAALPSVAAEIVDAEGPRLRADMSDANEVLRWVLGAPWPEQRGDNEYGDATFAVARTPRLRVELLFWVDGVARPHGHVKSGIFYSVHGERLHVLYDFERRGEPGPGLALGDLRVAQIELLGPGDLRRIEPDNGTLHALVFVGRPCVTLSVRGANNPACHFENDHLLVDDSVPRVTQSRLLRAIDVAARVDAEGCSALGHELLGRSDVDVHFALTLLSALRPVISDGASASLLDRSRARFGAIIDELLASTELWRKRRALEERLAAPDLPRELRLFLGLVWAGADLRSALPFLARTFGCEDPLALVDEWIRSVRGRRSPGDELAAALGLAPEDDVSALLGRFRRGPR